MPRSKVEAAAKYGDMLTKTTGGALAAVAIVTTLVWPLGGYLKAVTSWRFGVTGLLKYEIGTELNDNGVEVNGPMKPTSAGNLYLLRPGERGFNDLRFGDVLQSKGPNRFRENTGCSRKIPKTDCTTTSPEIFKLHPGQCVVVLKKHQPDSGGDDKHFINKDGGWVLVATTPCGLFE